MDCVIVRIKRLINNPYRKILSNETLYSEVNIDSLDCISYDTDHNLDEDSWFVIEDFSKKPYCLPILKEDSFDSKNYENLDKSKFKDVNYLISIQSGDFYFQNISRSTFIKQKGIIFLGEVAELEKDRTRLVIKELPDAVYFKNADKLIFKKLATIKNIFKGIEILYTEATQAEVENFLDEPFIKLGSDYSADKVSKPNRKRISFALEVLSSLSPEKKKDMYKYINDYCSTEICFDEDNEEFEINSDNDLKSLIYGIQERFYTTSFGEEKRLANSIKPLS